MAKSLVVVRGAGDLASGVIAKLYNSGYRVLALECEKPLAIRRKVSFSEAVYQGAVTIGGVTACLCTLDMADEVLESGRVPVLVDPDCEIVKICRPRILVDAILAKRNLGTRMDMADITIGLGPGFTAGEDVHAVIETKRGHDLGRIYYQGSAIPNTGIPGKIGGCDKERVLYAPSDGVLISRAQIGEIVKKGQEIARLDETPVTASIDGVLRGILPDGLYVREGWKMADIDPRVEEQKNCFTFSDKARCIAGGVLEAILHLELSRRHGAFSLLEALKIEPRRHRLVAVVGGGGKTTLIYELARELRECGLRAAVTTTTHMYRQGKYGFVPLGTGEEDGKIRGVAPDVPARLLEEYDVVLVEADGSRRLPVKYPASHEPVLPVGMDLVIGVAGAAAVGQTFQECCHRYPLACEALGCSPQDRVTAEHIFKILTSPEGQKKGTEGCGYRYLINQAERLTPSERQEMLRLQKQYGEIGSVVSFWEEKWYNAPVTEGNE